MCRAGQKFGDDNAAELWESLPRDSKKQPGDAVRDADDGKSRAQREVHRDLHRPTNWKIEVREYRHREHDGNRRHITALRCVDGERHFRETQRSNGDAVGEGGHDAGAVGPGPKYWREVEHHRQSDVGAHGDIEGGAREIGERVNQRACDVVEGSYNVCQIQTTRDIAEGRIIHHSVGQIVDGADYICEIQTSSHAAGNIGHSTNDGIGKVAHDGSDDGAREVCEAAYDAAQAQVESPRAGRPAEQQDESDDQTGSWDLHGATPYLEIYAPASKYVLVAWELSICCMDRTDKLVVLWRTPQWLYKGRWRYITPLIAGRETTVGLLVMRELVTVIRLQPLNLTN